MTTQFEQEILKRRPLFFWKGARAEDASSIDIRDLSGNGYDAQSWNASGHPDLVPVSLPGDDSNRRGWRGLNTGWFRSTGSAIPGFNATSGTIITFARILPVSQNSQALFDTAPSQVGALRMYTSNDWANVNFEVGGDAAVSFSGSGVIYKGRMQMFSLGWRPQTGSDNSVAAWVDSKLCGLYNKGVAAGTVSTAWGSVNGNSWRGRADFHSLMVFDTFLNTNDQRAIYNAAMQDSRGLHSLARLGRR